MDVVPAGADGAWEDDEDCTILRVCFTLGLLSGVAEDLEIDPARVVVRPRFQYRNSRIEHIALALECEYEPAMRRDRLVAESLARALALELIATSTASGEFVIEKALSPSQRRRVLEYIEAHIANDLSLSAIAQACGVSVTLLKVLFPRAFGEPVHQYVIRRRVEHAKQLIVTRRHRLSEVATLAGFAHQSHMTRMMRRVMGVTPSMLIKTMS
jgi:AraC family transcriptional regulator